MSFVEAIVRKRQGGALDREQIAAFVAGAISGDLPPEQLGAMLMAICCHGMDAAEIRCLTEQMLHSGETWRIGIDRPDVVDKHSTGGVGDSVSLVVAPLMAAVGVPVAMMAGRGLGHSQGTLDKLDAIPGFRTTWNRHQTLDLLEACGAAMLAQSESIAPADRVLYAIRDVTGTVPSLPLITSSIMSKKLALGAPRLVLDVKWGRGAFCRTVDDAVDLAAALRDVAHDMDVGVAAVITDMNQPLARSLGTACEVRAALDVLAGGGDGLLREVSLRLAREAMVLQGVPPGTADGELLAALDGGRAMQRWHEIVVSHGGDPDPDKLARPVAAIEVTAEDEGWVVGVAADTLGWVAVEIGAGRRTRDERLAHGAGLEVHVRIGEHIERGQPLATVLVGERELDTEAAVARVRAAFEIREKRVEPPQLILGTVDELERPDPPRPPERG